MPALSPLAAAWRTGEHIGPRKPSQRVRIQPGLMDHTYGPWTFLDGSTERFGEIVGSKHNAAPWHGLWRSTGPWIELPNVAQVDLDGSFSSNGVVTATIHIENVVAKAWAGMVGTFHLIKRGYLSPSFGLQLAGRPRVSEQTNEWLNVLNGGFRVFIEQGYGDEMAPAFTGLIDDTDITVHPDVITITARDFGQLLTDQRVFGWNKAREILPPVVFADRLKAMKVTKVSASAVASSSRTGHAASAVTTDGADTYWESQGHSDAGVTEWVEIHLPPGTYEQFWLWPRFKGMEAYVAVYGRGAKVDGVPHADGWIGGGGGVVPGANGGYPSVRHIPRLSGKGAMHKLPFVLECGANTVLRVAFRRLAHVPATGDYRAGVNRLVAYRQKLTHEAKVNHWILVDDVADVVKWVFMWAGFREWEVESFGARIDKPMTFNQMDYLIDIVNYVKSQGDYTFFMKYPTNDDSIGVPVFRHSRAILPLGVQIERATDKGLITLIEPKWAKDPLSYVIRVRGNNTSKKRGGVPLGQDRSRRYQATYFPPWSGAHRNVLTGKPDYESQVARLAGVRKHEVHTDITLKSDDECLMACVLIAIQECLASWTGQVEIPGYPLFTLDDHIDARDVTTGTNSRLWIMQWHSTFIAGDAASYKTTLAGSFMDTPDLAALRADYKAVRERVRSEAP